jgi:hypothetical protein
MRVSMRPPRLGRGPSFDNVTQSAEERLASGGSRFRVCQQSEAGNNPRPFACSAQNNQSAFIASTEMFT